ncbi:phosphate ABC transporter substrate-binding protein, PhoT family (TC 3.A.1.7.1) [Desulfonatronum thiosulfatophilum]|uniref:Phosphate ABC transporter substrate-binding protein, PhoT family (TC 3.A.1.7.1) n=1 Tax=Desulfonatronum thiosulfatophilum TaxID=617002 RepID=A0A1G6E7I9_9BACT|nr:substrate-binding domain-containing protein [Desulfonatronum thiosulfatophilum]SDB53290.1 phosphate ABC transporter substrate-binding protein, PhoT family (TC 3.A.1.7.1) [Desulfonatronum thiosulfatophilum]
MRQMPYAKGMMAGGQARIRALLFQVLALTALAVFLSIPALAQNNDVLRISGATTIQPMVEQLAEEFRERSGQSIRIEGGGSLTGAMAALEGTAHIGMVSRALSEEEKERLEYETIGMDVLVIIVNSRNPLQEVDKQTVVDLFTGRIMNWNDLTSWNRDVVLVNKEMGRSTLELFEAYSGVYHRDNPEDGPNGRVAAQAYEIASNMDGATLVGGIPGAVGYMSLGTSLYLLDKGMPIKILALDGHDPIAGNVLAGGYPIVRELNLVYLKHNESKITPFLDFCRSPRGREVVREFKYLFVD